MTIENSVQPDPEDDVISQPDLHAEEDGRNREWEDRARVNLENVPDGTNTNVERDFEPEKTDNSKKSSDNTAY